MKTLHLIALVVSGTAGADVAFFEQKIRPVLVEHCYECHSAEAKKLKGNLFLDSKPGWQKKAATAASLRSSLARRSKVFFCAPFGILSPISKCRPRSQSFRMP